jgi:uncharacterized membrane protein
LGHNHVCNSVFVRIALVTSTGFGVLGMVAKFVSRPFGKLAAMIGIKIATTIKIDN